MVLCSTVLKKVVGVFVRFVRRWGGLNNSPLAYALLCSAVGVKFSYMDAIAVGGPR
jgi:hypothetical protein